MNSSRNGSRTIFPTYKLSNFPTRIPPLPRAPQGALALDPYPTYAVVRKPTQDLLSTTDRTRETKHSRKDNADALA